MILKELKKFKLSLKKMHIYQDLTFQKLCIKFALLSLVLRHKDFKEVMMKLKFGLDMIKTLDLMLITWSK